jgi:hypothetical protein
MHLLHLYIVISGQEVTQVHTLAMVRVPTKTREMRNSLEMQAQ